MGGFTEIRLKTTDENEIAKENLRLKQMGIPEAYRFYSINDVRKEYEAFLEGEGYFPKHLFPKDKINSFEDFKLYWNTDALGEIFCPAFGALTFDCYFNRTPKYVLKKIGSWCYQNTDKIKEVGGSFSTFVERGMGKFGKRKMKAYGFIK